MPFSGHGWKGCCDFFYSMTFLLIISLSPLGRIWWKPRITQPDPWGQCHGMQKPLPTGTAHSRQAMAPRLGRAPSPTPAAGTQAGRAPGSLWWWQQCLACPFLHLASLCALVINIFSVFVIGKLIFLYLFFAVHTKISGRIP